MNVPSGDTNEPSRRLTPYEDRRGRAAAELRERNLHGLVLSPGSDLAYFTGYRMLPSERLTCLVLDRDGCATLVVPALEEPRAVVAAPDLARATWAETEDPIAIVAGLVAGEAAVAVADQMWTVFTLRLQESLPGRALVPASLVTRPLRMRKDGAEIDALREAARAADRAFERIRELRFTGRRERDIGDDVAAALRAEGHQEVHFTIVASGPNGASPHHETGERRIESGDAVVLDFGGTVRGYFSDMSRTVHVGGSPDAELVRVHDTVRRAQEEGYAAARGGATAESVDAAARAVIAAAGYGPFFIHRLGHGIGLDGHEPPYLVAGNRERLESGMTFSIEPGIYLPGRFGVRIEDIAYIDPAGRAAPLNHADHALAVVA